MENESSERIQTSILSRGEKKLLVWLAQKQPRWVTSDFLTFVGVAGAVLATVGGLLSRIDAEYLWITSFGLAVNWYGDSLDGTLARIRDTQRPVYGFFIDHTLDALATCFVCVGLGLSPMIRLDVALLMLAGYLCLSIYTYVCTIIINEFRLTYGKLGPTEVRILLVVIVTLYMYTPWATIHYNICGEDWGVFDIIGGAVATVLFLLYVIQFIRDRRDLDLKDPLKPYRP